MANDADQCLWTLTALTVFPRTTASDAKEWRGLRKEAMGIRPSKIR